MKCPLMLSWEGDFSYYAKSQDFYWQIKICEFGENDEVLLRHLGRKAYMRLECCFLKQGNYS